MSAEAQVYVSVIVLLMYLCFLALSLAREGIKKRISTLNVTFLYYILHAVALVITCVQDFTHASAPMQYAACIVYTISGYLALYYYGRYYIETCEAAPRAQLRLLTFNKVILFLNLVSTIPLIPSGLFFSVTADCVYHRGKLFFLSYLFVAVELIVLALYAVLALPNRKKAVGYVAFGALPLIFSVLMTLFPVASPMLDFSTVISCLILYAFVSLEDKEKALENETKLAKYKTDIMLSQIGPHFIYNTLSTISALCTVDPQRAQNLTADFTDYLRNNLNLAKAQRLSSFDEELNHTKKYLEIEKVRFGRRLNVEYDIRETNFLLPSLSLQPIVENAIKHGIMKKREGGTVRITSEKRDGRLVVTVSDDGLGFDAEHYQPQAGHYGLTNTRERLQLLLGGEMRIESRVGSGTTVTLLTGETEGK